MREHIFKFIIKIRFQKMENKKKRKLLQWTAENMSKAIKAVKTGRLSTYAASKQFDVPRMALSDRVDGRVKIDAKMRKQTYLSADDELSLCHYIDYMAKRGFPLCITDVKDLLFQSLKSEDMLTPLRKMVLEENGGDVSRNDTQSSVFVEQTHWTKVGLQWETKEPSEITSRYCGKRLMTTDSLTNSSRYTTVTMLRSTSKSRPKWLLFLFDRNTHTP